LLDTLAHCYTTHCTPGPSPYAYKRKVQGSLTRRLAARRGRDGTRRPLAPSRTDACNPLLQAHLTWAQDKHEGRGFPPFYRLSPSSFPPSCSVSRQPIWAGARDDTLPVGPGTPPGSKRRQLAHVSTPGVPGPTSKLSPRAPAQMGRREMEREGGKQRDRRKGETRGLRVCPALRSGALAVGGYKRPRGRE
jgi:hypothetical protein